MGDVAVIEKTKQRSVLIDMSTRYGMEPAAFEQTIRATCMPPGKADVATKEQFAAFLLVAKEYNLNPLTREIYAFPAKGGGIVPVVGVDGWSNLINSNPNFDGMDFDDELLDGKLISITCRMYRKDRSHPIEATEYMEECNRSAEDKYNAWNKCPRRMLRNKAMIQAARYAFGFAGIYDPDEAERIAESKILEVIDINQIPAAPKTIEAIDPDNIPSPTQSEESPDIGNLEQIDQAMAKAKNFEELKSIAASWKNVTDRMTADNREKAIDLFKKHRERFHSNQPVEQTADEPEIVDPEKLLNEMQDDFNLCGDLTSIEEVWEAWREKIMQLMPPDQQVAQGIYEKAQRKFEN